MKPEVTFYNTTLFEDIPLDTVQKDTYRLVLKEVRARLSKGKADKATVIRSRRGQWGEWYENWAAVCTGSLTLKATKQKEGWM